MSERIYLGQINISTDMTINGNVKAIIIGLIPTSRRLFTKIIREKNKNNKFINKKPNCHSLTKKNLHNAIKYTGTETKKRCGLIPDFSKEK